MDILSSEYIGSFPRQDQAPQDERPEFAFIGRSNVGKSSLINMLTERRDLAHISNKPGKTQHLNYYLINEDWYLVDLPGYGYAKVSKKEREKWSKMIEYYLEQRPTLVNAFVLIDAKIPPQPMDLEFCDWLGAHQVPFVLVFTKTDKTSRSQVADHVEAFCQNMLQRWESLPPIFKTSSVKRTGRDELLAFIEEQLRAIGRVNEQV